MTDEIIPCSPVLAASLVRLRRERWISSTPPLLDASVVESAIDKLGPLPDELVAYCAAIGSMTMLLSDEAELDSFYLGTDQDDWRARVGFADHVAFDAWGDWPRSYAVFSPGQRTFGVLDLKTGMIERVPTVEWLVDHQLADPTSAVTPDELAAFRPAIRRAGHATRRVAHAKFGTGVVLEELEGKLRIDFGAEHGIKVLASRFVTPV